jgi:hypothetical protein
MEKPDPDEDKSLLPNPDPVRTAWHKLFLFWEAYDKEFTKLLMKWHNDAAQVRTPGTSTSPRTTGNVLYDSFLDTWGKGNFEDGKVDLDKKSYFAALAVASVEPKDECLNALCKILKTKKENGRFVGFEKPLQLTVSPEEANTEAKKALDKLTVRFSRDAHDLDEKIDPKLREAIGQSPDTYLKALLRMMDIETKCFKVQEHFLNTGEILPGGT